MRCSDFCTINKWWNCSINGNTARNKVLQLLAEWPVYLLLLWEAIIARESNGQVNAADASGARVYSKQCQVGFNWVTVDDQIQVHIMHTTLKVCLIKLLKKIGLQFVNPFFLVSLGFRVENDNKNQVSKEVALQDLQIPKRLPCFYSNCLTYRSNFCIPIMIIDWQGVSNGFVDTIWIGP